MTTQTELSLTMLKAMEIIENAQKKHWMNEKEYMRTQAELRKLGFNVIMEVTGTDDDGEDQDELAVTNAEGRTFFEVSIHPFVEQVADEEGEPIDGDWSNTSGGEFSDEFGDDLDGYPDAMFRKGWSVSSWARNNDNGAGRIAIVDDEEFADYDTAIARAEELADLYHVQIDHRY